MKRLLYLLAICCAFAACSDEETPTEQTFLEDMFVINDDPDDPVQHKRYEIYSTYNVPVYFNDTIYAQEIGTDWYGKPVMRYETVDLNWEFDSYNTSLRYIYDYLETEEEKLNALNFVEKYLETCSRSMRPFSIMIANGLTSTSPDMEIPESYFVGFRTLVLYGIADITDNDAIIAKSREIISDMVLQKVKANENLCNRFGEVSNGLYSRDWEDLGGCPTTVHWNSSTYGGTSINALFHGAPYNTTSYYYGDSDLPEYLLKAGYISSKEEGEAIRREIIAEIGQYGFIKGAARLYLSSPFTPEEDIEAFTLAIVNMGKDTFTERFGNCPLVMQKFNILCDYMTNTLEIEL